MFKWTETPIVWQKCPVCEGRGVVPAGFYTDGLNSTSTTLEKCRTCKGQGIISMLKGDENE